jgi:periplasmic divalent cation tolerance protein
MPELCEVVITAPDPQWLKDFSRKLVEDRLCASAHNFAPVRSVYRWQGDIYERAEGRASLHTRRDRVADIVARAKQEHPYQIPGISTRPITDGKPGLPGLDSTGDRTISFGMFVRGLRDNGRAPMSSTAYKSSGCIGTLKTRSRDAQ